MYEAARQRLASPEWADDVFGPPRHIGPAFDALAAHVPFAAWSPARRALHEALGAIKPRHKLAVLATVRDEAPDLAEWFAHHLAIGVEKFFIYSNDNSDGTDALLRWFAGHAPVDVTFATHGGAVCVQHKHYQHALLLRPELRLYDWVAVIDSDEFLLPEARYGHNLPNLLAAAPADTESVLFPWHWRLWAPQFERGPGLLPERFPNAVPRTTVKAVSRLRHVTSLRQVHFPEFDTQRVLRDSAFTPVVHGTEWHLQQHSGAGGWTEHFWGKSFEEFLVKKARSEAVNPRGPGPLRDDANYFQWTQPLHESNRAPWPEAMLARTNAQLARWAQDPGFAAAQALVAAKYAAYAARVRGDAALRAAFEASCPP